MIQMQQLAAGAEAVVVCDVCGQRIADSSAGVVHYKADAADGAVFHEVFHVHKGSCQEKAEHRHGSTGRPWHDLIGHLNELRRNSGTSFKDLVLKEVGQRHLPLAQFNRLCDLLNEMCALANDQEVPLSGSRS